MNYKTKKVIKIGDTVLYEGGTCEVLEVSEDGGQVLIQTEDDGKEWVNFDWLDGEG